MNVWNGRIDTVQAMLETLWGWLYAGHLAGRDKPGPTGGPKP